MKFPTFKYHPNPIATGSVAESSNQCICCERRNGFIYTGPVYALDDLDNRFCPWCIADGTAAERFEAVFTDESGIGDDELAIETQEKVARRTPGFAGWQQERWLSCCNDAAAFLGPMGRKELEELGSTAIEAVRESTGLKGSDWTRFYSVLDREAGPTAFVFKCLHCSKLKAYTDKA
jgi:uncharacterized protein CbrC (UPF0167 family)